MFDSFQVTPGSHRHCVTNEEASSCLTDQLFVVQTFVGFYEHNIKENDVFLTRLTYLDDKTDILLFTEIHSAPNSSDIRETELGRSKLTHY